MKFNLQIEDKGRYVNIPLTKEEIETLYGLCFFPEEEEIKSNNFKIPFKKMLFLINDVLHDGVSYKMTKNGKFRKCRKKHYSIKKPKWKHKK